jgi:O-antigen ligase
VNTYFLRVVELQEPAVAVPQVRQRRELWHLDLPALSAWTLAFGLVTYLSLNDGGYDIVARSEAGIVVWWIVLLGALAGFLPARIGRPGWVAIGLLAGFAVWTGLAIGWSQSAEQSVIELGRIAAYLGALVLAIALQGRTAARHTLNGLACAIGLVTVLAVFSRLDPQAFPPNAHFQFLGAGSARKLSWPLNYWNGLADLAAMGVPLLLAVAVGARTIAARAVAGAILPLSAVCIYLTISRGGVIALGVGIAVFLALAPRRLEAVLTLLVSGAGAAILLQATPQRSAVTSGVPNQAAISQGTQLIWLLVVVGLGVALLQVAISHASRKFERPKLLAPDRRTFAIRAVVLAVIAIVLGVAAGVPGKLEHAWHDFKQPNGVVTPGNLNSVVGRLQAANGNGRYQLWQSAVHAYETKPWVGIGPGTFQFYWTRHATMGGFVRNAHSLYFETLAETGIIGLALLLGLLVWFSAVAVSRALRGPPGLRVAVAGASGSLAAFLFSAAVEWVWQLAAIAVTALLLGAVIVAGRAHSPHRPNGSQPAARRTASRLVPRAVLALLAIAALGAVLVPLAGQVTVRESQTAAAEGRLGTALRDSLAAQRLQPYAASAHLQEALVLEAAGQFGPAAAAARVATTDSPADWTTWLTLARIDARRGAMHAALAEFRRARKLNPLSPLFENR